MCLIPRSLLAFKVHQLRLRGRYCLLLPKMNGAQIRLFAERFEEKGFSLRKRSPVVARSREGTIRISQPGISWSSFDPSDLVLPSIPDILTAPKQRVPLDELGAMYFGIQRAEGGMAVRLSPRVVSSALWRELRKVGGCALAPDEHLVCSLLIRKGRGCELVTDFPCDGSNSMTLGRKLYFSSALESKEAISTLRAVGTRKPRNSYLRRDGFLKVAGFSPPGKVELYEAFSEIGDWCSFEPA